MNAPNRILPGEQAWLHPRAETMPPPLQANTGPLTLEINSGLDVGALAKSYSEHRKLRLSGLLASGAIGLHDHLQQSKEWIHLVTGTKGILEHDRLARSRLGRERINEIGLEAQRRARQAFQYRYEAIRVPDSCEDTDDDPLAQFAALMASAKMKEFLGSIIGAPVGGFADGQATAYGPGDFLTLHDDAVDGKNRLAAFVYGLTPGWRLDWGGLLLFHGDRDRDAEALAPRFNTLDLFAVPRAHSVSLVSWAAAHRRYAITGWLTG